ncbi:MAG: hypothetical protein ABI947_17845 [Chloroflexota bacterium]
MARSFFLVDRLYAILPDMNTDVLPDLPAERRQRLEQRLARWSIRLHTSGLDDLVGAFLDAAQPLAPIGAQVLWIAQPALGIFMPPDEIDGFARLLDDPAGLTWLRAGLIGADHTDEDDKNA